MGAWLEINGRRIKILKAKETNLIGPVGQINDKIFIIVFKKFNTSIRSKKEGKNKMKALTFERK